MIYTIRPHLHSNNVPSTSAIPMPSHNDAILRALVRDREALLAKTHAAFSLYSNDSSDEEDLDDEEDMAPRYDANGRQAAFRETVRQRQSRLEFMRRQVAAKRRASRRNTNKETVMASFSSSSFLSGYLSPPASPSLSVCSMSTDSDSDSLSEPDSDSEYEWNRTAPRVGLYVVDENEDEESEDDYILHMGISASCTYLPPPKLRTQQLPALKMPGSPRSPVARAPSLESIPE